MVTIILNLRSIICLNLILLTFTLFNPAYSKEGETILHFVHISDTHLHYKYVQDRAKLLGSSQKLLKELIKEINNINDLNFVLATGDLVDQPREELIDKFIEITRSLEPPLYVTLGNHDVGVNTKLGKLGVIKKFYNASNKTNFPNLKGYYSFSPNKKTKVICLDTTTDKLITPLGTIDKEQINWLRKELEEDKDKITLIALHTPPVEPIKARSHFFLAQDKKNLLDTINDYKNVVAIFAGDYELAKIKKYKRKYYITSPSTIKYPLAYREIIISREKKRNKYKYYMEIKWHTLNALNYKEIGKKTSRGWKGIIRSKRDRERRIRLKPQL